MAIPSNIAEVIRLANIQSIEESKLDSLSNKKVELVSQLEDLNTKIQLQKPIVQAARAELKAASALI